MKMCFLECHVTFVLLNLDNNTMYLYKICYKYVILPHRANIICYLSVYLGLIILNTIRPIMLYSPPHIKNLMTNFHHILPNNQHRLSFGSIRGEITLSPLKKNDKKNCEKMTKIKTKVFYRVEFVMLFLINVCVCKIIS